MKIIHNKSSPVNANDMNTSMNASAHLQLPRGHYIVFNVANRSKSNYRG